MLYSCTHMTTVGVKWLKAVIGVSKLESTGSLVLAASYVKRQLQDAASAVSVKAHKKHRL